MKETDPQRFRYWNNQMEYKTTMVIILRGIYINTVSTHKMVTYLDIHTVKYS